MLLRPSSMMKDCAVLPLVATLCGCGPGLVATDTGASTTNDASASGPGPTPTDSGPADTTTSQGSSSSPTDMTTSSATAGPDMGATPCTGEVVGDPACGGTTPYCVDGVCVGCGSLACAELDPNTPVCSDAGVCVECVGSEDCPTPERPACDAVTATCVACTEHAQCSNTACNLETGECFPAQHILYVDNHTDLPDPCSDTEMGFGSAPTTPFCTLQRAFDAVDEGVPTTIRVKDATLVQDRPSALGAGGYVVAIVGDGQESPALVGDSAKPLLSFGAGNLVFVDRLALRDEPVPVTDPAIRCMGATVWLDHVRITATATAMRATDCLVHVRRSVVTATQHGGLMMTGGAEGSSKLWLENSFITENIGNSFGPIRLVMFGGLEVRYSTIAFNKDAYPTIECKDLPAGIVTVRNSAIVEPGPHIGGDCEGEIFSGLQVETIEPSTLDKYFASYTNGEYRAKPEGLLAGTAQWGPGDPVGDFDGDPRPPEPPTPEYAGADQPR